MMAKTWAATVLRRLGLKPNDTTIAALKLWSKSEGNAAGRGYNWLNTTQPAPGSSVINATGVRDYASYTQGIAVTATELKSRSYSGITRALAVASRTGQTPSNPGPINPASLARIWTAINKSPWCKNCQTGRYPDALWTATNGKGATVGGAYPTILPGINPTSNPTADPCAWKISSAFCLLKESQLQGLKGGVIIAAGGLVMLVGVALVAAAGGRSAMLGRVQRAGRAVGLGGSSAPRTREADRQEKAATPSQLAGEPTPGGERLAAAEEPRRAGRDKPPVHTGPFDERDITPALSRRPHERRPRSTQHRRKART